MSLGVTRGVALRTALLSLPLLGLGLLLADPRLDVHWEHHPAHFWLVLTAALTNVVLAVVTSDAARLRADARLFLVSLTFLASAGFLGLHALATPGVLLESPNKGFVIATPIGLLLGAGFAAASSLELSPERSADFMRRSRVLRNALLIAMVVWAAVSLAAIPPLDEPLPAEEAKGWLLGLAIPGVVLYALAAARYFSFYRRRPARMLLGVITAFALLAEAMIAIAVARNWQATWWEWHLLMLVAFGFVAYSARKEWREERFSDLYLEGTTRAVKDVSVLFADLQGFTAFSERAKPGEVTMMLNEYFKKTVPLVVREHDGEIDKLIGDAIMVSFNKRGDQPDHVLKAVRAGLAIQRVTEKVARSHPEWPRFRVGINSGKATVAVVGAEGKREYTVVGDTVNLASRLEGQAKAGQVVIGAETYRALPEGTKVESLGGVQVKGKEAPVEAYVVVELPPYVSERDERLQRENPEGES
jgi:adenylate cyclase